MRTVLKWMGILLGGLLVVLFIAMVLVYLQTERVLNQIYTIEPEMVPITDQETSTDRGYPSVMVEMCRECHGPNLAGQVLEDDPLVVMLVAPNLTPGKGGIGSKYKDEDWVRALRHGVGQDGKTLLVMPSNIFNTLSDEDLGYIIAYMKNLHAVDNELPEIWIGPMGRIFLLLEPFIIQASVIDHDGPRPVIPEPGITLEYGEYLTRVCIDCHGEDFAGGDQVGAGLNITPGGDVGGWSEDNFIRTMRTGIAPDGDELDAEMMPTRIIGLFSDEELQAIWLFLKSLPAVETVDTPQS
jgi:mono/diheme cytochrome c family protein